MSWRGLLLTCSGLVAFWVFLVYPTVLPYPPLMRIQAMIRVQHQPHWPISKEDYQEAMREIRQGLAPFEFIDSVRMIGTNQVLVSTIRRYNLWDESTDAYVIELDYGRWKVDLANRL